MWRSRSQSGKSVGVSYRRMWRIKTSRKTRATLPGKPWPVSLRFGPRSRRQDPERAVLLDPGCAFVAQQGAANLAGIIAQADADHLETFRVLVPAEQVGEEIAHAVGDRLRVGVGS